MNINQLEVCFNNTAWSSVTQFPCLLYTCTDMQVASVASKVISSYPDKQLLCLEQAITMNAVSGFVHREFESEFCLRTHCATELIDALDKAAEGEAPFPGAYLEGTHDSDCVPFVLRCTHPQYTRPNLTAAALCAAHAHEWEQYACRPK